MTINHRFDTKINEDTLRQRGFVWYGNRPVAFVYGENYEFSLCLPYETLRQFPYYSASYGGLSRIDVGSIKERLALLEHWMYRCFDRPISVPVLDKAVAYEKRAFKPTFSLVADDIPESAIESDPCRFLDKTKRGVDVCVRKDSVTVTRHYQCCKDLERTYRRLLHKASTRSYEDIYCVSKEGLAWYLNDTKQKKIFVLRLLRIPTSTTEPYSIGGFDGCIRNVRRDVERRIWTPRFVQYPCHKASEGLLVSYGTLDKIERQWFVPRAYKSWLFPCGVPVSTKFVGEDDAIEYYKEQNNGDDLFSALDKYAMSTSMDIDPEGAESLRIVTAALNEDLDDSHKLKRHPHVLLEILLNGRDPAEVLYELEKFRKCAPSCMSLSSDKIRNAVAVALHGAVEFQDSHRVSYSAPVFNSYWRRSADLIKLKEGDRWI